MLPHIKKPQRPMAKKKTKSGSVDGQLVLNHLDQVKALTHPIRQRLFELLAKEAATSKQLADILGYKPTRLYHHMATLEQAGLIKLIRTERVRGSTAKYYQAVADSLRIDPTLLGDTAGAALEKAGLGVIDGLLTNLRSDVEHLFDANLANEDNKLAEQALFMQFEIQLDEKRVKHYRNRLNRFLDDLRSECEDNQNTTTTGDGHRLFLGWYPNPKNQAG